MKTIGIVACFFGTWPRWADLFLESCRHNSTVDFFLMTDCLTVRQKQPSGNVRVVDLGLTRFKELASERLGIPISFKKPYKVCDLRPAFGVIFEDFLKDYDFWGYCDLDVVFGDIREFMNDELLEAYDVIASRREFITGHFTLFRNVGEVTRLYERSRDYRKVFTGEATCSFEECGGGLQFDLLGGARFADVAAESKVDSLMHVVMRSSDIRAHLKTICDEYLPRWAGFGGDVQILWKQGRLVKAVTGEPIMYFHLNFLKDVPSFYMPHWKETPAAFMITRQGIFWIGEQPLRQRMAHAVQRRLYFLATLVRVWRLELLNLARARVRKWLAPSAVPTR